MISSDFDIKIHYSLKSTYLIFFIYESALVTYSSRKDTESYIYQLMHFYV